MVPRDLLHAVLPHNFNLQKKQNKTKKPYMGNAIKWSTIKQGMPVNIFSFAGHGLWATTQTCHCHMQAIVNM